MAAVVLHLSHYQRQCLCKQSSLQTFTDLLLVLLPFYLKWALVVVSFLLKTTWKLEYWKPFYELVLFPGTCGYFIDESIYD